MALGVTGTPSFLLNGEQLEPSSYAGLLSEIRHRCDLGAALLAGGTFHRWLWVGLRVGATFGLGFVHWLVFQCPYRIGALCPYRMVVWVVMIPISGTRRCATSEPFTWSRERAGRPRRRRSATAWYLVIAGLIAERFWDYWSTLLP